MVSVDVLLPTYNRLESLIMTLCGLSGQTYQDFNLILSDQSREPVISNKVVTTLLRMLEARGRKVQIHYRVPSQGIAEQRDFLLRQSTAKYVLYLDDDVWMEPWVLEKMVTAINTENCGFVGAFPAGLSFINDIRPDQQNIEFWDGPVQPEALTPESSEWQRWNLHRAANLYHISKQLPSNQVRLYKIAWVASCILYHREKLLKVGGFSFWSQLPHFQSGEEVLVQNLLLRRWGGCGIIPSGTFYSELPSTVLNDHGTIDQHALTLLDEMIERYAPKPSLNEAKT